MNTELLKNPWILAQSDMAYFAVKFLGMKWPSHYEEWSSLVEKHNRLLVECPRGHGKSYFFSLAYPLWRVIRGKRDILLVSYSEDQVRRLIREIRVAVETNPFLEPLRPSTKETWGTDMLSFPNGATVSGLGFGTSSRGRHPDDILVDDPLKDLGGMTDEDQERAYFGVLTGMAMENTKIITVGTPVNFNDLLSKLEANPAYTYWRRPALDPNGVPLFPDLWSKEALDLRRKEMGSINFSREFLLERIDPATQPFKSEYQVLYDDAPPNFARVVTVCDPAYTESDGDATAIVTVGFTHGNHAYVLEAKEVRREDPGAIVNELFKSIDAFDSEVVGIEKRKGDAISYSFDERRTREERWDFAYVELKHGGVAKGNRIKMVGGLIPRWEARAVHVRRSQTALLQQLYRFRFDDLTKGHDDLVDALAYCFHPDMAQPNTGRRNVPLPETSRTGKALYVCGQAAARTPSLAPLTNDLWRRLDRRVSDAA